MSRTLPTFLIGAAAGAAAAHFLDPDHGARRRNTLRDKTASKARSSASGAQAQAKYVAGQAKGVASAVTPSPPRVDDADDVTLARKVESIIFRSPDAPKGDVSVDVQGGIAYLRGTVADEEWIERLCTETRGVDGIKGVKNLLHRPGTPAPAPEPRAAAQERLG